MFFPKNKTTQKKTTVKVPLKEKELKKKTFIREIFDLHNLTVLMASFYKQQEEGFQKCLEKSQPVSIVRPGRKVVEKAVAQWSFMSNIPSIQKDQPEPNLKKFICELKTKHGLSSRFGNKYVLSFSQLQSNNSRTRLSKGKVFAVDTQEQFIIALTQAFQRS